MKAHQFDLKLVDAPRLAPFEFPADATVGMRVLLTCSILRGQQPISFVWLKDNQIIATTQPSLEQTVASNGGGLSLGQLHRQQLTEKAVHLNGNQVKSNVRNHLLAKSSQTIAGDDPVDSTAASGAEHDLHNQGAGRMRLDYVIYNAAPGTTTTTEQQLRNNNNNNQVLLTRLSSGSNKSSSTGNDATLSSASLSSAIVNENRLLPLLSDPSIRIRQSDDYSILSIEGLELKHSGRYTCSAQNEAAQASHSSQLTINGEYRYITQETHISF